MIGKRGKEDSTKASVEEGEGREYGENSGMEMMMMMGQETDSGMRCDLARERKI